MVRKSTVENYHDFLCNINNALQDGSKIQPLIKEYGVSSTVLGVMKKIGYLEPDNEKLTGHKYKFLLRKVEPFHARKLAEAVNYEKVKWAENKASESKQLTTETKPSVNLVNVGSSDIFEELKRRGYTGTLVIKKEIQIG